MLKWQIHIAKSACNSLVAFDFVVSHSTPNRQMVYCEKRTHTFKQRVSVFIYIWIGSMCKVLLSIVGFGSWCAKHSISLRLLSYTPNAVVKFIDLFVDVYVNVALHFKWKVHFSFRTLRYSMYELKWPILRTIISLYLECVESLHMLKSKMYTKIWTTYRNAKCSACHWQVSIFHISTGKYIKWFYLMPLPL